ncbi:MAG: DUF5681 domain-containing protein [Alphaproteobacteria bacterium]
MPENTAQKQDTRFQPGQSGNPAGKPKGARNKTTQLAEKLMSEDVEGVVHSVIEAAKGGDMRACEIVLSRICPPRKGRTIEIDLPDTSTSDGVSKAQAAVLAAAAAGEISPDEAKILADVIESRRKAIETLEHEARIRALEDGNAAN